MKGAVFTELFDYVEDAHGPEFLQETIDAVDLPTKGVYATTGTYPTSEMVSLVSVLSNSSGIAVPDLLRVFGEHLFGRFTVSYPALFEDCDDAFSFLASVENVIHMEVRKLYPDAELPTFETAVHTDTHLQLIYRSRRHMGDLCEGLIRGCLAHFEEEAVITRTTLEESPDSVIKFDIEKQPK